MSKNKVRDISNPPQASHLLARWVITTPAAAMLLFCVVWVMSTLITPKPISASATTSLTMIDFIRALTHEEAAQTKAPAKADEPPPALPETPSPPLLDQFVIPPVALPPIATSKQPPLSLSRPAIPMDFLSGVQKPAMHNPAPALPGNSAPIPEVSSKKPVIQFQEDLFPLSTPDPIYPSQARRRRIEGWVNVGFTINTDGNVEDLVILAAEPERIFDHATLKMVSRWKFKPQLLDGKPTPRRVVQTIDYELGK